MLKSLSHYKCQQALFILHSPSSGITVGQDLTMWSTSVQNVQTRNAKAVVCLYKLLVLIPNMSKYSQVV